MTESLRVLPTGHYHVAWISAVDKEFYIASALLDEVFDTPRDIPEDDENGYVFGRIGSHNVVMATLPEGRVGVEQAGRLATDITRSFKRLRFGLMVGIAGGAPTKANDIRLGDVVVSTPNDSKRLGGVVHYYFGASIQESGFQRRGSLNAPPDILLSAIRSLGLKFSQKGNHVDQLICQLVADRSPYLDDYLRPDQSSDVLFNANFLHVSSDGECADLCAQTEAEIVTRTPRASGQTVNIHRGVVGSASNLMRDANLRNKIAEEEGVMCFEMESAGLMNNKLGWLVVRGICDYSDTHKNDRWQKYAAAVAAVYAKELLKMIRPRIESEPGPTMSSSSSSANRKYDILDVLRYENMDVKRNLAMPQGSFDHNWIWTTSFNRWLTDSDDPFWICGKPASGKSTLVAYLLSHKDTKKKLLSIDANFQVIHYFYDYNRGSALANNTLGMLRSFLYQLAEKVPVIKSQLQQKLDAGESMLETEQSLLNCTCEVLNTPEARVCAFIDGLDEYEGNYIHLMNTFKTLIERTEIKLCFACRPEVEVSTCIKIYSQILAQDYNRASMQKYAENMILHNSMNVAAIRDKISDVSRDRLIQKAEGIILWFRLAFDELIELCLAGSPEEQILAFVEEVPKGLESLFQRILDKIHPSHRHEAGLILRLFQELERLSTDLFWHIRTTNLDHLWGIYDIVREKFGSPAELQSFKTCADLKQHITSLLRGLLETHQLETRDENDHVYNGFMSNPSDNSPALFIRYIHKTFRSFLERTRWADENLPLSFQKQWPNAFFLRLAASTIKDASEDGVLDADLLHKSVKEYSILLDQTSTRYLSHKSGRMDISSRQLLKYVLKPRYPNLFAVAREVFPHLQSMLVTRFLEDGVTRSRQVAWQRIASTPHRYSLPEKWRPRLVVLKTFYYSILRQAGLYEHIQGSTYSILAPVLHSDQCLVLAMLSSFDSGLWHEPVRSALVDHTTHQVLDLLLAVDANLPGYFAERTQHTKLSPQQWALLTSAAIYQFRRPRRNPANIARFLQMTVPHSGMLDEQDVCLFFCVVDRYSQGSVAQALLPFLHQGRSSKSGPQTHAHICSQRFTDANILFCCMNSLRTPYPDPLYVFLSDRHKEHLNICKQLGFDVNTPCYKRGTALRALFDKDVCSWQMNGRQGRMFLDALIGAGLNPNVSGDLASVISVAETIRRRLLKKRDPDVIHIDVAIDCLYHFRQYGQWPQDDRLIRGLEREG